MRQLTIKFRRFTRSVRLMIATSLCLLMVAGSVSGIAQATDGEQPDQTILITEVKLGGNNTTPAEYVTLYNASDTEVSLEGWRLEYAKSATPVNACESIWKEGSRSPVVSLNLSNTIASHAANSVEIAMNNASAGSVHVMSPTGNVTDLVGWGSAGASGPCAMGNQAVIPADGSSLQRYLNCQDNSPQISYNNAADFVVSKTPVPGRLVGQVSSGCGSNQAPTSHPSGATGGQSGGGRAPVTAPVEQIGCMGIILSELLPNPTGTDTGHEFIELYNPTNETIPLDDCSLQTSVSTTKKFVLDGQSLDPGSYQAFYDTQTGLSLPNASGGTVWLLGPQSEIDSTSYAANLDDDQSWALADGLWQTSYSLTPGAANIVTSLALCPSGQFRNPETNRCNTISDTTAAPTNANPSPAVSTAAASTSAAACPAGQSRNPATNRCRKDTASSSVTAATTAACKAGQERNPETNRCRNITTTSSGSTTKACPSGQERNPSTNRCRKIAASTASAKSKMEDVKDVRTAGSSTVIRWGIALLALVGAALYGLYEWRQEILSFIRQRILRINNASPVANKASNQTPAHAVR